MAEFGKHADGGGRLSTLLSAFSSVRNEAARQWPSMHVPEAASGAVLGGALGALYDQTHSETPVAIDGVLQKPHRLRRLLHFMQNVGTGALIGGAGADLASDRFRRYFSNLPGIGGYDANQVLGIMKREGLKGLWTGGIKDEIIPHTHSGSSARGQDVDGSVLDPDPKGIKGWPLPNLMRRELLRHGMNVNQPDDYFQTVGRLRGSNGKDNLWVQLNENRTDPQGKILPDSHYGDQVGNALFGSGKYFAMEDMTGRGSSDVFPHYIYDNLGLNLARVRDSWNVTVEPRQRETIKKVLGSMVRNPRQMFSTLRSPLTPEMRDQMRLDDDADAKATQFDYLKSVGAQHLMDKVFLTDPPLFNQTVGYDPQAQSVTHAFSNITHDAGVTKDDKQVLSALKPMLRRFIITPSAPPESTLLNPARTPDVKLPGADLLPGLTGSGVVSDGRNKHADVIQQVEASPWVADPRIAIGTGAVRGALVGAGVYGINKLVDRYSHEKKHRDEVGLWPRIAIGTTLGAGAGAVLYSTPKLIAMAQNISKNKTAHWLDPVTKPIWMDGGAAGPLPGIALGGLYGAGFGAVTNGLGNIKRWVTGEKPKPYGDAMRSGAAAGMGITALMRMSGQYPGVETGVNQVEKETQDPGAITQGVASPEAPRPGRQIEQNGSKVAMGLPYSISEFSTAILNDPTIPTWKQVELIRDLERAQAQGVQLTPQQLVFAGLGGLAGWMLSRMGGAGSLGQTMAGIGGALLGGWAAAPDPNVIYGTGYYRP